MKGTLINLIAICILLSVCLDSCYITRTTIGNGPVGKEDPIVVYSKARQCYLFLGLAALNKVDPPKPADANYQIVSYLNVFDVIVTGITFGVFSTRTIKVLTKPK